MTYFNQIDFNELTDVDQSIYGYISNNIEKVPYMRVREIAKESHTSSSSVMRFIRKIGFDSYNEFKYSFKETNSEPETVSQRQEILGVNNFSNDVYEVMEQVARLILQAENIVFFGMGSSGAMCDYAARRLATIGFNAHSLTDPTFPLYQKLKNTADNIVIVLSITGNTVEVVEAVNGYKNLDDFKIVAITSDKTSNIASMADYILAYRVEMIHLFHFNDMTSQLPTVFLIEELIDKVKNLDDEY
ncbi:MurR/RpiR family transcriptional regulator [Alkalibacterium sp. f15]|uniref:MurR/RpiR family transcriptional regulator n=1 Tax=Alkalibacterium sp. f15 TaxID=3414029 RepID=UPI003BF7C979